MRAAAAATETARRSDEAAAAAEWAAEVTEREARICASPLGRSYLRLARQIAQRAEDAVWEARDDAHHADIEQQWNATLAARYEKNQPRPPPGWQQPPYPRQGGAEAEGQGEGGCGGRGSSRCKSASAAWPASELHSGTGSMPFGKVKAQLQPPQDDLNLIVHRVDESSL